MAMTISAPWSSSGTRAVGTRSNRPHVAASRAAMRLSVSRLERRKTLTPAVKPSVTLAKNALNHLKNPLGSWVDLRIRSTHRAGVRVRATMPEMMTEMAMVMANCRYITPARPPRKPTGMKTAHSTSTMAMTGAVTSLMALAVA